MGSIGDCRFVAMRCAGYDRVDLGTCAKLGITVARVPTYSPNSVAEHAVAMLMCLNRCDCLSRAFQTGSQNVSDRGGRSVSNVPTCAMSVSLLFCCACTTACGQLIACSACGAKTRTCTWPTSACGQLPICPAACGAKPGTCTWPTSACGRATTRCPAWWASRCAARPSASWARGPSARPPAVSLWCALPACGPPGTWHAGRPLSLAQANCSQQVHSLRRHGTTSA